MISHPDNILSTQLATDVILYPTFHPMYSIELILGM